MLKNSIPIFLLFFEIVSPVSIQSQVTKPEEVRALIDKYKVDARGPYQDIRWFCKDGSTRAARDPCPDDSGNQHARYKEAVIALAKKDHIFLGQILTSTSYTDFWDTDYAQSRLKQYQLEQYLRNIDNGWINRRAQFYRGATQAEDENNWGMEFYQWLLEDAGRAGSHFFLIRQSAKDIPHKGDNNTAQLVRTLSSEIAEAFPAFQDLRIKIHGMPDAGVSQRVLDFQKINKDKIPVALIPKFDQLMSELNVMYRPFQVSDLAVPRKRLPLNIEADRIMERFIKGYPALSSPAERCQFISSTAIQLRHEITTPMKSTARLALIDISNRLESLLNAEISQWKAGSLKELLSQVYCLSEASAAFGFLELWEWEQLRKEMVIPSGNSIDLQAMSDFSDRGRNVAEWGAGMVRAHYMPVINLYRDFEPLATGFFDDRIRSSVLLYLGYAVSRLGEAFSKEAGFSNSVLAIPDQSSIRGLNPGYAVGQLIVVTERPEKVKLSPDKIYIFHSAPDNLKPVAGIATVTEGNLVSHVQLLARNLGIPNAVISRENMEAMKAFHRLDVFYAVSNSGTVIIKPAFTMAPWEFDLFKKKKQREEKISVPIDRIVLDNPHVLNMANVNASHSGKICGPKAANLGQLKQMFPDNVVEGLVLPFSIFRQHMDQTIPGYKTTYWSLMNKIFKDGESMRKTGSSEPAIETFLLKGLDSLRILIKKMPLLPSFRQELQQQFQSVFGQPLGNVPVFVRSDTNMEDLKDFTGAGLNLTVFNVVDAEKIFQGIRDVWASPYTERSFKWRQRYLNNPENVFPSIVIIPSVDADHSGVMITKGLTSGRDNDITVAFNRGVGGAVDGQAAETWLLRADGADHLITPAREATFLTIPATGGSVRKQTTFEHRILTPDHFKSLRTLSARIQKELPGAPGISTKGPFDMELGFRDGKMWLFQVRPFVENKQAAASEYLKFITPEFNGKRSASLDLKI
jgi:Pyruvate phosphate dikinase, AMP/ATP-binding domain